MSKARKIFSFVIPDKIKKMRRNYLQVSYLKQNMISLENELLKKYHINDCDSISPIFIVASPRTGSTVVHQMIVKYADVTYFSNISRVLHFTPLLSWLLAKSVVDQGKNNIACKNEYGVSEGIVGPSEASLIFNNWFPSIHPSEIRSSEFFSPVAMKNMQEVFSVIYHLAGKPVITKNAWNCFRLEAIKSAFPQAKFIYLQRNIIDSSYSTLQARKRDGNPQFIWNSASPANLTEIKKMPYYMQVVEQQIQTNQVVENFFRENAHLSLYNIKYEDFLQKPSELLKEMIDFCGVKLSQSITDINDQIRAPDSKNVKSDKDKDLIIKYCKKMDYL